MRFFTPELISALAPMNHGIVLMAQTQLEQRAEEYCDVWAKSSLSCRNDSRNCSIGTIFMTHESSIILSRGTATPGRWTSRAGSEPFTSEASRGSGRPFAVVLDGSVDACSMPVTVITPSFVPPSLAIEARGKNRWCPRDMRSRDPPVED